MPPIETPPATTENPVNEPGFELRKTADPASGTRVDPGSVITYTVTGVNTGETALAPVRITDDLSGVLAHAAYNDDAAATVVDGPAPEPVVEGDELTWSGALAVGQARHDHLLGDGERRRRWCDDREHGRRNRHPARWRGDHAPARDDREPGRNPGLHVREDGRSGSGTAVATGSVVTYTLVGTNTGETGLDDVAIADDLSGVLRHADLRPGATAVIGDRTVAAPSWTERSCAGPAASPRARASRSRTP